MVSVACHQDVSDDRLGRDAALDQPCRRRVFSPGICWRSLLTRVEGSTMGQILHGSATTTEAVRRAIQHSQESLRALARRHGINQKTVAKWKRRGSVSDLPTGPREPRSTILSIADEAIIVAFPQTHAAATRRLPLCIAGDDPTPHAILTASLSAASWYRSPTTGRR